MRARLQDKLRQQTEQRNNFWQAAQQGDLDVIKSQFQKASEAEQSALLKHMPSKDAIGPALFIAISNNHNEVAQFLIDQKPDLNQAFEDVTAIELAIVNKNYDIVLYLINAGVKPNQFMTKNGIRQNNATILNLAISLQNTKIALLLITQGANVKTLADQESPLALSAYLDLDEVIKAIIEKGANLEEHLLFFLKKNNQKSFNSLVQNIADGEQKTQLLLKVIAQSLPEMDKAKIIILIQNKFVSELIDQTDEGKLLLAKAIFKLGLSFDVFLEKFKIEANQIVKVIRYIFSDNHKTEPDRLITNYY